MRYSNEFLSNKELTQQACREASEAAKIERSEEALIKIVNDIVLPNGATMAYVKTWANNHNVRCMGSPFEADWQLAHVSRESHRLCTK